jgi:hypothetical protein
MVVVDGPSLAAATSRPRLEVTGIRILPCMLPGPSANRVGR